MTKCNNRRCPSRNKCYRYIAVDNPDYQFTAKLAYDTTGKCRYFVPFKSIESKPYKNEPKKTLSNTHQVL